MGVGNIISHSATAITNAANGSVKCVVSEAAMTGEFLLRKYISNGLDLTPYLDGRCQINMASPPIVLVRVSSLTATTTNYVDRAEARTSSAKEALPSNSLSPPTAPQTESSRPDNRPTTVLASPPPRKTADVPSRTPSFASSEPVHSDLLGLMPSATTLIATGDREAETVPSERIPPGSLDSVPPAITLIATGDRDAEPPNKTGKPDQPQELGNVNLTSRPGGELTPTVPVSQFPPTRPVFGTTETVALSSDSSLPIRLSSIVNPTDNFLISDRIRPVVTNPISLDLPELIISNARLTTSVHPLPSILTFTNQDFTVPNPSHFFLSSAGTTEIPRGGSTITFTSDTRSISLGDSATTIIVDESSTTTPSPPPHAADTVGTLIQVPATQVTTNYTFPLPPATTTTAAASGNRPQLFLLGGQTKLAEVPMLIMFGATFLGIAGRAMVGITLEYV